MWSCDDKYQIILNDSVPIPGCASYRRSTRLVQYHIQSPPEIDIMTVVFYNPIVLPLSPAKTLYILFMVGQSVVPITLCKHDLT